MKKILTFIVAYSFVYITAAQLIVNSLYLFCREFYIKNIFYMAIMSGLSFLYLIPMVAVAFLFKFCMPSRICAIAQVLMAILWLVIKDDNIYNITAQSIICFLAILLTFKIKITMKNWKPSNSRYFYKSSNKHSTSNYNKKPR